MTTQLPIQTEIERTITASMDRKIKNVTRAKPMSPASMATISKTQEPRFETAHHSWEYFQNELEFE